MKKLHSLLKKDNSKVLLGNLSASAFGLLSFMILARALTQTDFGKWALFVSLAGLLDLMKTGLVRQAYVRAITADYTKQSHLSVTASAWLIALVSSAFLAVLAWLIGLFISDQHSLHLFFSYYPIFGLAALPYLMDTWQSHATGSFSRMNNLRLFVNLLFISFLVIGWKMNWGLDVLMWGYIGSHALVSIYSVLSKIRLIRLGQATKEHVLKLLHFGKHSIATLTGSNLLKSADSLMIGAFMSTEAVAIYAIPLKLLDLMEIPLRGFLMTSFRQLTQFHEAGKQLEFKGLLTNMIGRITLFFLPVAIVILLFPDVAIRLLGGDGYAESVALIPIFLLIMLLLPLDKFIGVSFDSIDKPGINASKVWLMVIVNLIGDIIVIQLIGELWAVALVTLFNILAGIAFGYFQHPYFRFSVEKR